MKIIRTYPDISCNKKILFVKRYLSLLWVFTDFFILLVAFWIQTMTTRQLIPTARTLEAEWWQVCGEAWVRGQRKMSQVLGAFGLLDFAVLRSVLAWRAFSNLRKIYFLILRFYFSGRGQTRILNPRKRRSTCIFLNNHFARYGKKLALKL